MIGWEKERENVCKRKGFVSVRERERKRERKRKREREPLSD